MPRPAAQVNVQNLEIASKRAGGRNGELTGDLELRHVLPTGSPSVAAAKTSRAYSHASGLSAWRAREYTNPRSSNSRAQTPEAAASRERALMQGVAARRITRDQSGGWLDDIERVSVSVSTAMTCSGSSSIRCSWAAVVERLLERVRCWMTRAADSCGR